MATTILEISKHLYELDESPFSCKEGPIVSVKLFTENFYHIDEELMDVSIRLMQKSEVVRIQVENFYKVPEKHLIEFIRICGEIEMMIPFLQFYYDRYYEMVRPYNDIILADMPLTITLFEKVFVEFHTSLDFYHPYLRDIIDNGKLTINAGKLADKPLS